MQAGGNGYSASSLAAAGAARLNDSTKHLSVLAVAAACGAFTVGVTFADHNVDVKVAESAPIKDREAVPSEKPAKKNRTPLCGGHLAFIRIHPLIS